MKPKPLTLTAAVSVAPTASDSPVRRFELVAYTGEAMDINGFDLPVVIDISTINTTNQRIPALFDHDPSRPVGQVQSVSASNGLPPVIARGVFTPSGKADDCCPEVIARADAGFQWQASVGGNPERIERYNKGEQFAANGRTYEGPALLAFGLKLKEISFVSIGGDGNTSAVVASNKRTKESEMTYEEWLVSMGFDTEAQTMLTEIQGTNLKKLYDDEYGEEVTETEEPATTELPVNAEAMTDEEVVVTAEGDVVEDEEDKLPANASAKKSKIRATAKVAAERVRISQIVAIAKKYGNPTMFVGGKPVKVAAHAVSAGWDTNRSEVQAMRSQLVAPPSNARGNGGATLQALQGAMLLRAGGRLDHKGYGALSATGLIPSWLRAGLNDANRNRIMDEAHRFSKLSAVDVCSAALRASGRDVPHDRDDMIRAAFSSASLTNVMTTSMNAILLSTYLDTPDTTQGWVREQDVPDYKLNERPRVEKGSELSPHPENAEADHDTMTDTVETYKVERFSRQFVLDEIAIINDSLGAIGQKPQEFGAAAARLRPNLVYATLLANPTLLATGLPLFNGTNGNANTSVALNAANLSASLAEMATIRENGVNIDVTPSHLIVPFALRDLAVQLTQSPTIVVGGTAGVVTQVGVRNPLNDWGLFPTPEKRLDNGVSHPTTGLAYVGSASTWYLASNMVPAFEVGYLRGSSRAPKTRSWTYDRDGRFGMGWDVSIAIGVCPLDWRGIQRNSA